MSSIEKTKSIEAVMIIEIIGKPPEHLTETLEDMINQIGAEKGVNIIGTKIRKPVLMKDQKEFYTSFAELEIKVETVLELTLLMFKYMPSHIEILSPQSFQLSNNELNEVLNEIIRRLHGYDEVARVIQAEKVILENKLKDLLGKKDEK